MTPAKRSLEDLHASAKLHTLMGERFRQLLAVGSVVATTVASLAIVPTAQAAPLRAGREVVIAGTDGGGASGSAVVTRGAGVGLPKDLDATVDAAGTNGTLTWKPPVAASGETAAPYSVSTSPATSVQSFAGTATGASATEVLPGTTYVVSLTTRTVSGLGRTHHSTLDHPERGFRRGPEVVRMERSGEHQHGPCFSLLHVALVLHGAVLRRRGLHV